MEITKIGMLIYVVRGQRVMVDWDLAVLYGVPNKALNQAVKRKVERFPDDFMFKLTPAEAANLRSQTVTANIAFSKQRYLPNAFTEQGVAMLSGVLKSERAVRVNIEIMRAFVNMRRAIGSNKKLAERMEKAEKKLSEHEGQIGNLFAEIEALTNPSTGPKRHIGFAGDWDSATDYSERGRRVMLDADLGVFPRRTAGGEVVVGDVIGKAGGWCPGRSKALD